jgi:hypothetical protein
MVNFKFLFAKTELIALLQPAIGLESLQGRKTESMSLHRQLIDPEGIVLVGTHQCDLVTVGIFSRLSTVIDMAVGEEHIGKTCSCLLERSIDLIEIAPRINRDRLLGTIADQ